MKQAHFLAKEIETTWVTSAYGDREEKSRKEHVFVPMTADEARAWILDGDVEIIHDRFAEGIPEAEAEDGQSATLYFRVPETLKQRVVQAAAAANMSTNTWLLRCAEGCLKT
jgi:predicted HicB family RNase H-like nuclease